MRDRKNMNGILGATLLNADVDGTLLLEGAWLLATSADVLSHEEPVLLSTLARMFPAERRAPLRRLRFVGEGAWIVEMALLDDARCDATLGALEALAGRCGGPIDAERRFLERTIAALGREVDLCAVRSPGWRALTPPHS